MSPAPPRGRTRQRARGKVIVPARRGKQMVSGFPGTALFLFQGEGFPLADAGLCSWEDGPASVLLRYPIRGTRADLRMGSGTTVIAGQRRPQLHRASTLRIAKRPPATRRPGPITGRAFVHRCACSRGWLPLRVQWDAISALHLVSTTGAEAGHILMDSVPASTGDPYTARHTALADRSVCAGLPDQIARDWSMERVARLGALIHRGARDRAGRRGAWV